jgi:hypothetical protein
MLSSWTQKTKESQSLGSCEPGGLPVTKATQYHSALRINISYGKQSHSQSKKKPKSTFQLKTVDKMSDVTSCTTPTTT